MSCGTGIPARQCQSVGMADKHGSEPCARKGVGVQLSPLAHIGDGRRARTLQKRISQEVRVQLPPRPQFDTGTNTIHNLEPKRRGGSTPSLPTNKDLDCCFN